MNINKQIIENCILPYLEHKTESTNLLLVNKAFSKLNFERYCSEQEYKAFVRDDGETTITPIKNGVRHGTTIIRYPDGRLKESIQFVNGARHGLHSQYYENGQLQSQCSYMDGMSHGLHTWYHETGQWARRGKYVNGKSHGLHFWFYDDRWMTASIIKNYDMGEYHGRNDRYYPNGKLKEQENYVNGKQCGDQSAWDYKGKLLYRNRWDINGKLINSYTIPHNELRD